MRNKTMRRGLAWILSAATIMGSVPVSAEELIYDTDVVSEESEELVDEQDEDAELVNDAGEADAEVVDGDMDVVVEDGDGEIVSGDADEEEEAVIIDGTEEEAPEQSENFVPEEDPAAEDVTEAETDDALAATHTYADEASHVTVEVTVAEEQEFPEGTVKAVSVDQSEEVTQALNDSYEEGYSYQIVAYAITDAEGNAVTFPEGTEYKVTDDAVTDTAKAFTYKDGALAEVKNTADKAGTYSFQTDDLSVAYIWADGLTEKEAVQETESESEPETEIPTEVVIESETEAATEAATESETETAAEVAEEETEAEEETAAETQPQTAAEVVETELESEEVETETDAETESETEIEEYGVAAYAEEDHTLSISVLTGNEYYDGTMTVSDDAVWEKVKDATVQVSTSVKGDAWEAAKNVLNSDKYYDGTLKNFTFVQMKLVGADGKEISLTEEEKAKLSTSLTIVVDTDYAVKGETFQIYTLSGTEATELKDAMTMPDKTGTQLGMAMITVAGTDGIALVGNKGLAPVIEEGTYTVTANLTVWGEDNTVLDNTKVYMTNTDMPPLTPAKENAKLVVKKDANGKKVMTVTVSNLNPVFMLQEINSGTDVTVVDTEIVPVAVEGFRYATRIDKVVMTLANTDGVYEFGYCKQSPQIASDQEMKMHLEVDFDSLIREFSEPEDGEYSFKHVFTDKETGVSVSVKTTEEELGKALETGNLEVADVNLLYDAQIQSEHTKKVNFKAYNIGFVDQNGKLVSLKGRKNTEVIVTIPSSWKKARLMPYRDGEFVWVKNNYGDGTVSYGGTTLDELGTFALVDDYQVSNWITSITTKSNVTATYSMPSRGLWVNYASARSDSSLGTSSDYSDNSDYKGTIRKGLKTEKGRYYVGFGSSSQSAKYITGADGSMIGDNSAYPEDYSKLSMTFPYTEGKAYYLVKENGTTVTAKLLNGVVDGSNITVDIISQQGTTAEDGYRLMQALWNGLKKKTASLDTEVAYILETTESVKYASMPTATWITSSKDTAVAGKPYTYDGKEHTGYAGGENCTITGDNTAIQAGTYTVTVTPNEGYTWTDGTSEAKNITWTIEKAELKVQYKGEVVSIRGNAKKEVEFSGWVNGENENTARNFDKTKFYVTLPDDYNTKEQTLNPVPAVEEGANEDCDYAFVFTAYGKLAVTEKTVIEKDGLNEKIAEMSGAKFRYGKSLTGRTTREMLSFVEKGETAELKLPEGFKENEITKSEIGTGSLFLHTDEEHIFNDGTTFVSYNWSVLQIVDKPELKTVFTYNGQEYTVGTEVEAPVCVGMKKSTQQVRATEAGNYTVTVYYSASHKYIWRDQLSDWENYDLYSMGDYEINWSIVPAEEKTVTSTETVTANLYIKASDAKAAGLTVLEALAGADGKAYLTNPNAPVAGSNEDQDPDWQMVPPTTPVTNNATLVTYTDGTMAVKVPVKNSVFTLQKLGSCEQAPDVVVSKREGSYVALTSRIDSITVPVTEKEGSYVFNECSVYPTLLDVQKKGTSYTVPLTLEVGKAVKQELVSIANAEVSGITDATYTGKAITQRNLKVTLGGGVVTLKEGTDYTVSYSNNVNVGTATITITGIGNYKDTITKTFAIKAKTSQTIKVKVASKTYDYTSLQAKAASFAIGATASGKLTYKVTSTPKNAEKYISVNTSGTVTLKKNAPVGTYKITVSAAATSNLNAASTVVTVKVNKSSQKITVKTASKTYKTTAVVKKNQTFTIGAKATGKVTYKVASTPKNAEKYISVNRSGKVTVKKNAPAGTYKITVSAAATSVVKAASSTVTVKVNKSSQTVTAKVASKTVKTSQIAKKNLTFAIGAKGAGKLTYKVTSTPKRAGKYISVNKNGKVTVKKNAPKGTYKITVTVAGNAVYTKAAKTVTVTVK